MTKKKWLLIFILIVGTMVFSLVMAKELTPEEIRQLQGGGSGSWWQTVQKGGLEQVGVAYGDDTPQDIRIIAVNIIRVVLGFLGIIALILIFYAGFKWLTSAGNEDQIADAKKILMAGVIGLIIILSSFALATFILNRIIEATTGIPVP